MVPARGPGSDITGHIGQIAGAVSGEPTNGLDAV